jgi:hypothetical protein
MYYRMVVQRNEYMYVYVPIFPFLPTGNRIACSLCNGTAGNTIHTLIEVDQGFIRTNTQLERTVKDNQKRLILEQYTIVYNRR